MLSQTERDPSEEIKSLLKEGDAAFDKLDFEKARTSYQSALKISEAQKSLPGLADAYYGLGKTNLKLAQYEVALQFLKKAVESHELTSDKDGQGFDLIEMARVEIHRGNYKQAKSHSEKALGLHEESGNRKGIAEALHTIGIACFYLGQNDKTLEVGNRALRIFQEIGDQRGSATVLNLLGGTEVSLGNNQEGIKYFEKTLEIAKQIKDLKIIQVVQNNIAGIWWDEGNYDKALEHLHQSLKIAQEIGDKSSIAESWGNIGLILSQQGRYAEAMVSLQKQLKITEEIGSKDSTALCLQRIAEVRRSLGDSSAALQNLQECLRISQNSGHKWITCGCLEGIGYVYEEQSKYAEALEQHRKALRLREEIKDKRGVAMSYDSIGGALRKLGKYDESISYYQKSLKSLEDLGDQGRMASAYAGLALTQYEKGAFVETQQSLTEAIRISEERGIPESLWRSLHLRGKIQNDSGKKAEAIQSMKLAIDVIEGLRSQVASGEERTSYFQSKVDVYHNLIHLMVTEGKSAEALQYAEQSRARSFLDLLAEAKIDPQGALPPDLRERKKRLQSKYSMIQKRIRSESETQLKSHERLAELNEELKGLEEEFRILKRDIRIETPQYAELSYPQAPGLRQIQELLNDETALMEYTIGKHSSYLFTVTKRGLNIFELPDETEISNKVQELRSILQSADPLMEKLGGLSSRFSKVGFDLYNGLIQPAESSLSGITHLLIVPDGILNYLPFEVLLRKDSSQTPFSKMPYLLNEYQIRYVPSAAVLAAIQTREHHIVKDRKAMLAFANSSDDSETGQIRGSKSDVYSFLKIIDLPNLPYARIEVQQISKLYRDENVTTFFGQDATEGNVKQTQLDQYRKIHFAVHGLVHQEKPELSSLVMSLNEDENEDGYLMMREIFDLKLNSDLVVLSACKSGTGQNVRGEGVINLARAFIYAGTKSVIVSLWNVADQSTANLMKSFYQKMELKRMNPTVALTETKREMSRSEKYSHPYYWATFVLIGDE
ncbi:CHAT domain-containing protein [bacterium]|nr:CHAT domain-containing protein [bacterium]